MPGARAPFRGQAPPANIDSSLMERVAGRTAFSVGAREYGWVDVVLAAHLWGEYANLERSVLRQRWASELDKITKAESVTAREVSDALYAEAVCSGALGELGERLAAQAAIYDRVAGSKGGRRPPGCSQAAVASLLKRLPATVKKTGVAGLTPGATSNRGRRRLLRRVDCGSLGAEAQGPSDSRTRASQCDCSRCPSRDGKAGSVA